MQGQANHFVRYAPEKIEYGMKRYTNETKRLYGVIEKHLASGKEWLAADQYTIADMANFAWIAWHDWAGDTVGKTGNLHLSSLLACASVGVQPWLFQENPYQAAIRFMFVQRVMLLFL